LRSIFAGNVAVLLVMCGAGCKHDRAGEGPGPTGTSAAPADITAPVAREGQRPPKPTPTAAVPTPSLPRLASQAAHTAPPPRKPKPDEHACGTVWTGEDDVPLLCDAPPGEGHAFSAAIALIPYDVLRAPQGDLPVTVDHRVDGFEGRTLNQGKASTCTAFSLASQIDHAIGLWTGKPGDVSPMQIWARYHVGHDGGRANLGKTFADDASFPYDAARAGAWAKCKRDAKSADDPCLSDDEKRRLDELDKKGAFVLEQVEHLPGGESFFDAVAAKLAAGRDVGTGGKLPKGWKPVGDPGSKYIPDFPEVGTGAHAFTLTGYTRVDGERYFLVKNSWGEKWGDGGYAWIHEKSLGKIVRGGGTVVIVDPRSAVGLRRRKRHRALPAACGAGQAPDSVDGACKPLCGDGGPRHGGYCGVTDDCDKGFVNVTGYCVLAAPKALGTEPKTGIVYACAPSGCVYTLPKGVAGCNEATCQKSCPAPDFRLGSGKGGVLCLE
jgi:Papain family cysteine protease